MTNKPNELPKNPAHVQQGKTLPKSIPNQAKRKSTEEKVSPKLADKAVAANNPASQPTDKAVAENKPATKPSEEQSSTNKPGLKPSEGQTSANKPGSNAIEGQPAINKQAPKPVIGQAKRPIAIREGKVSAKKAMPSAPPGAPRRPMPPRPPRNQAFPLRQPQATKAKQGFPWQEYKKRAEEWLLSLDTKRILIVGTSLLIVLLFFVLPTFRVQEIIFTKELIFSPRSEVLALSELEEGQHFLRGYGGSINALLTGRYLKAEEAIRKQYPQFKEVEVRLQFPNKVIFNIQERVPIAYMKSGERIVTLDKDAVVCGVLQSKPSALPLITGIDIVSMALGETLTTNADKDLSHCVAVMGALAESDKEIITDRKLLPAVEEIRSTGYQRILLTMKPIEDKRLTVACTGKYNLKDDFIWLSKVLEAGVLDDKLPGTLDIYDDRLVFSPEGEREEEEIVWAEIEIEEEVQVEENTEENLEENLEENSLPDEEISEEIEVE